VRSVLFRFPDLQAFESLVGAAGVGNLELTLTDAELVEDGQWLLTVFELGEHRRATSVAARAVVAPGKTKVVLEPRDCRRLVEFARVEAGRPVAVAESPAPLAADGNDEPVNTERSVVASSRRPPSPAAPRSSLSSGPGAHVLVVDDDDVIRDMVATMLEAVELRVTTARSAEAALALLQPGAFDLVVLDWALPKMTGVDLCRLLRQMPGFAALPVLFLTANTSSSDLVEAFACGADDYVVKPFRAAELGARIFSLLRRARLAGHS
jgi:two-component system phosphate regulon response regulator PhoB